MKVLGMSYCSVFRLVKSHAFRVSLTPWSVFSISHAYLRNLKLFGYYLTLSHTIAKLSMQNAVNWKNGKKTSRNVIVIRIISGILFHYIWSWSNCYRCACYTCAFECAIEPLRPISFAHCVMWEKKYGNNRWAVLFLKLQVRNVIREDLVKKKEEKKEKISSVNLRGLLFVMNGYRSNTNFIHQILSTQLFFNWE